MADSAPKGYVSVNEAMDMLAVSRQRVYQLVGLGRLPHRKVGNRVWIPRRAVEDRLAGEQRLASNQCISTQEVAEFFGVNERTVREWQVTGALKAMTINNQLCFNPVDVIKFSPPSAQGGAGRPSKNPGTRTIRGQYFPLPGSQA